MIAMRMGMVPKRPPMLENATAATRVIIATSAPTAWNPSVDELSAILTAVADRPTPMTTMTEATSTGGRSLSSQPEPTSLTMPATTR